MEDDNLFDEDDALDCIIFEELEKENKQREPNGCLAVVFIAAIAPASLLASFFLTI